MGGELIVRRLTRQEMDWPVAMAAAEGWNPGPHDADAFWAADPRGWWGGELDHELVSCISTVAYDGGGGPGFGFVGFYIVRPDRRGQGLGPRTWTTAMGHLDGLGVGLDAVLAQAPAYERSGFAPAYVNRRNRTTGGGTAPQGLVPLARVPFGDVAAMDAASFPVRRERFLRAWLAMPNAVGLARTEGGRLRGFGVIRSCGLGHKIGPLLAEDAAVASDLLDGLRAAAPRQDPVFWDTPGRNASASDLARERGMDMVFETVRMYRGPEPDLALDRLFGVASFELG